MLIRIQSRRGDHNATLDNEVSEMVFNKIIGKTEDPLPKEKIPDTWHELDFLFQKGKCGGFIAVNGQLDIMKEFDPKEQEIMFVPPHVGG